MLKLYSNQLGAQLKKSLAPVYLVFGEEPLQKVLAWPELKHAPLILETPGDAKENAEDIAIVRRLISSKSRAT